MKNSLFLFALLSLCGAFANAQTCITQSAEVEVTADYASDALTFCGVKLTVQSVLPATGACTIPAEELVGKKLYLNSGTLVNGHDCEVDVPAGVVRGLVLKNSAGTTIRLDQQSNSNIEH